MTYQDEHMQQMLESSHLSGVSAEYIEQLYEAYLHDASSIPTEWQQYFSNLPTVNGNGHDVSHEQIREHFMLLSRQGGAAQVAPASSAELVRQKKQAHVLQLINSYRAHGHHHANLDPLALTERHHLDDLDLSYHQLSQSDFSDIFSTESPLARSGSTLKDIYNALQKTYCGSVGIEYMHISDSKETKWIQQRVESVFSSPSFSADEKKNILKHLTAAEGLEKYLGSKYVGQKRFSLEGGDSLVPMLAEMTQRAGAQDIKEVVIGMAHRGRLNVLVNILGKSPEELFDEFEGKKQTEFSGDVKYHMGFSSDIATEKGALHLTLAFNPSHLEIIGPVVEGSVRSRQRRRGDLLDKGQVLPIVIHGDSAFAGQGVVMETFNFSQARGYSTGGTVHIVINNQVGFTTSNPVDTRSTLYCTDVAKMVQAPIIHVNGNDPEAVVFAAQLALDFRNTFKKDIVIDMVCYRRHGHNEADEPSVTQPHMYQIVREMPTPRELYAEQLEKEGVADKEYADGLVFTYRDALDKGDAIVKTMQGQQRDQFVSDWRPFLSTQWDAHVNTGVEPKRLQAIAKKLSTLPSGFSLHPVVKRLYDERNKMTAGEVPINWGYAEIMAYASLVDEGFPVRLSGQDSGRGTFAHRHAVLHDFKTSECYIPLQQLAKGPDQVIIIDSVLSEEAVLAFEYGYAASEPNVLVLWEAQFGDFANGAQVVIDQFISSGEQKWGRLCGLVMLLPHGFEGQGPEHSSARLERFLQLCAQQNMQVCVPTTPAQVFHMLRRQMIRPFRKPLVVMTPKSLLRHKLAVSTLEDLETGQFHLIIPEIDDIQSKDVRRVILCSGKVYYDLLQERRKRAQSDVVIIRIEQLYPFPKEALKAQLKQYKHVKDIVWCQEEPKNQGAWFTSKHNIEECLLAEQVLHYAGRGFYAAPAVGTLKRHNQEQQQLVDDALA